MNEYNKIPDIEADNDFCNPSVQSPNSHYKISFYLTKDDTMDIEEYKRFLENAIKRFRTSVTYKHYKGFLMSLGMDKCQMHGNITEEMATIEMHHNMLTIFDIALILCEHTLNTKGYISTFDLVMLLREEHTNHRVQLVMLSLTPHQLYHNSPDFFVHPSMCFGNWYEFLKRYYKGITPDVSSKLSYYLEKAIEQGGSDDSRLLDVKDAIINWSYLNI